MDNGGNKIVLLKQKDNILKKYISIRGDKINEKQLVIDTILGMADSSRKFNGERHAEVKSGKLIPLKKRNLLKK